ncbi:hypothetical protein Bbelb_401120 [Branchiostoma belcheri]|nr:hypothetical protein Bbelb_401120 [Branchiostoma belcheri]
MGALVRNGRTGTHSYALGALVRTGRSDTGQAWRIRSGSGREDTACLDARRAKFEREEDFLEPVRVTLPWAWKKSNCGTDNTVLMERKSNPSQWSLLRTEFHETEDAVTFTTRHFSGIAGAKESGKGGESSTSTVETPGNQEETANREVSESNVPSTSTSPTTSLSFQACWNSYTENKVYLIINPNKATTDNDCIHLMCVHKDDDPDDFFHAENMLPLPPFQQRIIMGREERIDAKFDEEKEVIGDSSDLREGIIFFFPLPPVCNRSSVGLILNNPSQNKKMYKGAVHFRRLSESGAQITDLKHRIPSATVFFHSEDEGKTSQVQQKEGTVITMIKASQIQHKKGGKRKAKRQHVGESSDSGPPVKRPKQESARRPLVLLLNDEYGTRKGGISTVNRQIGCFLASKGAKVLCTVLNATQQDKDDAAADGIQLIFPTTFPRDRRKAEISWLTFDHQARYPDLPSHVDFIVGHVHITSHAARRIKERFPGAKLIQVTHVMPEETSQYKGDEKVLSIGQESLSILDDLRDADVLFSVGPLMYDYYRHQTNQLTLQHHELLPKPSDIFIDMKLKPPADTETKVVLSIGRVKGVERLKGVDLAATTMGKVINILPHTKWRLRGIRRDDFQASRSIIEASTGRFQFVPFTPLEYGTQEELCEDMRKADVVLMPSRAEPFGLVGLEAIAAGVPVVISNKSGLAKFLTKQDPEFDRTIVEIDDDDEEAAKTLSKRIIKILKDGPREFKAAQSLKKKLLESEYWAESHSKLLQSFGLEG